MYVFKVQKSLIWTEEEKKLVARPATAIGSLHTPALMLRSFFQ